MPAFRVEYLGDLARVEVDADGIDGWEEAVRAVAQHHACDDAPIAVEWIGTGPGKAVAEYEVTVGEGDDMMRKRAQVYPAAG